MSFAQHLTTPVFGKDVVYNVPNDVFMEQKKFIKIGLSTDNFRAYVGMIEEEVKEVETANDRGEKVLQGTAEIAQPTTLYVFTGQGSQEQGMSVDLYNSSLAARAVWDGADACLLAVYGFSIIEIVKDNLKQKTIHFGGIKGQAIRQHYMDIWICHTTQWTGMVMSNLCKYRCSYARVHLQPSQRSPFCHSVCSDCACCN